jgi:Holliday junction resolvasome RuvABC ATP-dependent DNA helicase subunit
MIDLAIYEKDRAVFEQRLNIDEWWITPLHKKYLDILAQHEDAVGVKTLAAKLGMNEKALETDIEPLLLKLGKIEKTTRGRVLR